MPYPIRTPNNRLEFGEDLGRHKPTANQMWNLAGKLRGKLYTLGDILHAERREQKLRSNKMDKNNTEKATLTRARMILSKIIRYGDKRPEDMTPLDFVKLPGCGHVMLNHIRNLMTIGVCVGPWCWYHNMDGKECASPWDECEWWIKLEPICQKCGCIITEELGENSCWCGVKIKYKP